MLVSYQNSNYLVPSPFDWVLKAPQQDKNNHYFEENVDHYCVAIDVPGVSQEGLDLEVKDRILSLKTTRKRGEADEKSSYRWRLPRAADPTQIRANLADGVVTLVIPKNAQDAPRKIEVKVGAEAMSG